jgi:hypothetical protein
MPDKRYRRVCNLELDEVHPLGRFLAHLSQQLSGSIKMKEWQEEKKRSTPSKIWGVLADLVIAGSESTCNLDYSSARPP